MKEPRIRFAIFPISNGPAPDHLDIFSACPDVWVCCFLVLRKSQMFFCARFPISDGNGLGPSSLHVFSAGPCMDLLLLLCVQQHPDGLFYSLTHDILIQELGIVF